MNEHTDRRRCKRTTTTTRQAEGGGGGGLSRGGGGQYPPHELRIPPAQTHQCASGVCDRFRGLASARWQLLLGSCFSNRSPLAKVRVGVSVLVSSSAQQVQSPESEWGRSPKSASSPDGVCEHRETKSGRFPQSPPGQFPPLSPQLPSLLQVPHPYDTTRHNFDLGVVPLFTE